MKNIMKNFLSLDIRLRIVIIFCIITLVLGVTVAATIINNNNNNKSTENNVEEIDEAWIEVYEDEPIIDVAEEENIDEQTVKFDDKEIVIKKAEVSTKEDGQKKKSGGESVSAEQAVQQFENEGQSVGIDVSYHNGTINWAEVRNSGIEFAIIRVGYRGNSAGTIYEDVQFRRNVTEAAKHGVKVGIYFYSTAINEQEALEEAAWTVSVIRSYSITYPVVYDFEDFGRYRCSGVNGAIATANAKAFLNYVASSGYTPMMYANKNDITTRFQKSALSQYRFWLAHYTSKTDYAGSYQMWQYTSQGKVPGISGNVDMNIAYFRYGAVAQPKHTHDFAGGTVVKNTPASCTVNGEKIMRCSCGEVETTTTAKLGHNYPTLWTVVQYPTISEDGLEKRKCEHCENEETRKINKLEENCSHSNYVEISREDATCEKTGLITKKCENCGDIKTEIIDQKDHVFVDGICECGKEE